jgi:transcriptional regulator with XRE-family HTH domain
MARALTPLPERGDASIALAQYLREIREKAGMTLRDISMASGVSEASLSKAFNGDPLMSQRTVNAVVRACRGDKDTAMQFWRRLLAQREQPRPAELRVRAEEHWSRAGTLVVVPDVQSEEEFLAALTALRLYSNLSLQGLSAAARARGGGSAPSYSRTTLGAVLQGQRPMTFDHLAAVLCGCGVPVRQQQGWARVFAQFDPARDMSQWHPRPLRKPRVVPGGLRSGAGCEEKATVRIRYARLLAKALQEQGMSSLVLAARGPLEEAVVARLLAGRFVPGWCVQAAFAAVAGGSRLTTRRRLRQLMEVLLHRRPAPAELREWTAFQRPGGLSRVRAG